MVRMFCACILTLSSFSSALAQTDLLVASWSVGTGVAVKRYDGATGVFVSDFAVGGGLFGPTYMTTGPDGHQYLSSFGSNEVIRFNGTTGDLIDTFVTAGSGGLSSPTSVRFGPDGNLYVNSTNRVLRYNGTNGSFIDAFVPAGSGGLSTANHSLFSPVGFLVSNEGTS